MTAPTVSIVSVSGDHAYALGRHRGDLMLGGVRTSDAPEHILTRGESARNFLHRYLRGSCAYPENLSMAGLAGQTHQYLVADSAAQRRYDWADTSVTYAPDSGVACITVSAPYHERSGMTIASATEAAYGRLFDALEGLRMHPARIWNYMPDINRGADAAGNGSGEAYKQFNAGRYRAWERYDPEFALVCSATGIGSYGSYPQVEITCLATRHAVFHLDNPNQIPFLQYDPGRFGIQPCSRRGTVHLTPRGAEIYVAGTASIIGQENRHAGDHEPKDVRLQMRTTLENIQSLVERKNLQRYVPGWEGSEVDLRDMRGIRVYVRNSIDLPAIRAEAESAGICNDQAMYLLADICRRPLDVEIEGVFYAAI